MTIHGQTVTLRGCILRLHAPAGAAPRRGEPVTCGVPLPRGAAKTERQLSLVDAAGSPVALQARALDLWSDGSIRWALLDWLADSDKPVTLTTHGPAAMPPATVSVRAEADRCSIHTGAMDVVLHTGGRRWFERVTVADRPLLDAEHTGLEVQDEAGNHYAAQIDRLVVEAEGPIRAAVRLFGRLVPNGGGEALAEFIARVECFAGSSTLRVTLTLTNPRAAAHRGGYWDLGDAGSVYFKDVSFRVTLPRETSPGGGGTIRYSAEPGSPWRDTTESLEIYQDSSGGENWKSSNHVNRKHEVPLSFRGYRVTTAVGRTDGLRATPAVAVCRAATAEGVRDKDPHSSPLPGEDGGVGVTMPHFWQNFPKALQADGGSITLGLFPRQFADVHELQGGEQKTHVFYVSLGTDVAGDESLAWQRQPMTAAPDPAWVAASQAIPCLAAKADDPHDLYKGLVDAAIEGGDTFEKKREAIDEYGWRHFGDVYGDHEAVYHEGPTPLVSHYNNQYDAVQGLGLQFLRGGDVRWMEAMREMAIHVIDIDLYHTDRDKSAYNRGQFWHTCHYLDADASTHRTYPRRFAGDKKCPGGGPSGGQLYTSGLMLHHFLTGDPLSREAAVALGRYVIDADDGRRTVFRFLDRGPTGHITTSGDVHYHGPGRAPANSLNALLDAHRLTGAAEYLAKAEQLVRRCIHPHDDIAAHRLGDVENKWFYTMFLQALGKYLDHKIERRQIDRMYAYGRAALLAYARWMAEHEHPYLDKPAILEYPTETWAAQDMRKCEVFQFAARHAEGAERDCFLERAGFFFDYSTRTLAGMETRTLCRPVVLLLTQGVTHAWFKRRPLEPAPAPGQAYDFGRPERFVPQKVRAKKRAKLLVAAAAGAVFVGLIVAAVWVLR